MSVPQSHVRTDAGSDVRSTDPSGEPVESRVPRQRVSEEPVAPAPPPVIVDHVRRHGRSCYWDVAECRWRCGPG